MSVCSYVCIGIGGGFSLVMAEMRTRGNLEHGLNIKLNNFCSCHFKIF